MLIDLIGEWDSSDTDDWGYAEHYSFLELASRHTLLGYEPCSGDGSTFLTRLAAWVGNLPPGDLQRQLFRITEHIHFVSQKEQDASFRYAFDSLIPWWLIEAMQIELQDPTLRTQVDEELRKTWFCGITDSLLIARFHHVNQIEHQTYRPDWRTLTRFADPNKIGDYMTTAGLHRLVLLEDFVGSGKQAGEAVTFAASLPGIESILVIPLVICAPGLEALESIAASESKVTVSPVHVVPHSLLLTAEPNPDEPPEFGEYRELVNRTYVYLSDNVQFGERFGFRGTGALTVLYSNCPNNTLPLIHQKTSSWAPLFPRTIRT